MRTSKILLFLLPIVYAVILNAETMTGQNLDSIRKGVETHLKEIKNAALQYQIFKKDSLHSAGKLYLEGNKKALEKEIYKNGEIATHFKVTYVNPTGKSLYYNSNLYHQGSIFKGEPPEFAYNNPCKLFMEVFRINIVEALQNRTCRLEGKEKINQDECYIVSGEINKDSKFRLWIAPEKDFRPLKMELKYGRVKGFTLFIQNIKLQNIDGIWFPVYGEILTIGTGDEIPFVIKVIDAKLNKSLSHEIFDIKFPPGTTITKGLP